MFYQHYSNPFSLGISRLIKLLFIADWQSSKQHHKRLLPVEWINTYSGPRSKEVIEAICNDTIHFEIEYTGVTTEESIREMNFVISPRKIKINTGSTLPENDRKLLDEVIADTADTDLEMLNKRVWQLFPFLHHPKQVRIQMPAVQNNRERVVSKATDTTIDMHESSISNAAMHPVPAVAKPARQRQHGHPRHIGLR